MDSQTKETKILEPLDYIRTLRNPDPTLEIPITLRKVVLVDSGSANVAWPGSSMQARKLEHDSAPAPNKPKKQSQR